MDGQLFAQLRVLGVDARDGHGAFGVSDPGAFVELFDAPFGAGERMTHSSISGGDGGNVIGMEMWVPPAALRARAIAGLARPALRLDDGGLAGFAAFRCALVSLVLGQRHRRHFVRAAVIDVVRRSPACSVGIASSWSAGISVVASTTLLVTGVSAPFGTTQVSVRSPSVDS